MVRSPRLMIAAPGLRLACAISSVGSSRKRPFRNTRSASASTAATDGAGSKVCELTPSGTTPRRLIRAPPTLSTMLVMGETVATTLSASGAGVPSVAVPAPPVAAGDAAGLSGPVPGWLPPPQARANSAATAASRMTDTDADTGAGIALRIIPPLPGSIGRICLQW